MTHTSVGQQLAQARSQKGISLDQAAHVTKIRPDKLAALESDDFSAFPNNTYARGFLLIYGKFLHVEVSELANKLENDNPISVEDYQYLSAPANAVPEQRARMRPRETRAKRPSIAPLIVFVVLVVFVGFGAHFYMNTKRIGDLERVSRGALSDDVTPAPENSAVVQPAVENAASVEAATSASPGAAATPQTDASLVATDSAPQQAANETAPNGKSPGVNELSIEPVKKSWVRIRRDDPVSEPIFDDFLYPGLGPLKVRGTKFFVEVRDDGQVEVRKNGQPLAYHPPGILVQ